MGSVVKKYIFDYENKNMAYESRRCLEDKVIKAITEKKLKNLIKTVYMAWKGCG